MDVGLACQSTVHAFAQDKLMAGRSRRKSIYRRLKRPRTICVLDGTSLSDEGFWTLEDSRARWAGGSSGATKGSDHGYRLASRRTSRLA